MDRATSEVLLWELVMWGAVSVEGTMLVTKLCWLIVIVDQDELGWLDDVCQSCDLCADEACFENLSTRRRR